MNHLTLTFQGSVTGSSFMPKLQRLREVIKEIKDDKLESRHAKLKAIGRLDAEASCREVFAHLKEEVGELEVELLKGSDSDTVLKEVADVINCVEIIGALVMDCNPD